MNLLKKKKKKKLLIGWLDGGIQASVVEVIKGWCWVDSLWSTEMTAEKLLGV